VSRRYVADLKSKLGRFALSFGERLVCDITSQQLDEWLRSLDVNVISRDAYRRDLGAMFELARRRGYCAQNVAAEIRFSKRHKDEVTVLSPHQTVDHIPFGFSGVQAASKSVAMECHNFPGVDCGFGHRVVSWFFVHAGPDFAVDKMLGAIANEDDAVVVIRRSGCR
jgi:hypothetical protein